MKEEKPKLPLEHRYSAGGVLVRRSASSVEFCLIKPQGGKPRWQIPKGTIDPGEHSPETAVREVLEETGHRGRIVGEKLDTIEYWYVDKWGPAPVRVHKRVTFFLLELEREDERAPDPVEVAEARFFPVEEAIRVVDGKPEKAVLEKARARLA